MTNLIDKLERIVDEDGIDYVIEGLADVCHAKAEHIEGDWQDAVLARMWQRQGDALIRVWRKILDEVSLSSPKKVRGRKSKGKGSK